MRGDRGLFPRDVELNRISKGKVSQMVMGTRRTGRALMAGGGVGGGDEGWGAKTIRPHVQLGCGSAVAAGESSLAAGGHGCAPFVGLCLRVLVSG